MVYPPPNDEDVELTREHLETLIEMNGETAWIAEALLESDKYEFE